MIIMVVASQASYNKNSLEEAHTSTSIPVGNYLLTIEASLEEWLRENCKIK